MTLNYVITGASRGLGLEFVKQVSLQGHLVFALARHPESSGPLQALLKDRENVIAVKMDTTCENSIKVPPKRKRKERERERVQVVFNFIILLGSCRKSESKMCWSHRYFNQ